LDPNSWRTGFFDKFKCTEHVKKLVAEELQEDLEEIAGKKNSKESIWGTVTVAAANGNQLLTYIHRATISSQSGLDFWKSHIHLLPAFRNLVRKYFSKFASTALVERYFSASGNLVSKKTNRTNNEHVELLMFLR